MTRSARPYAGAAFPRVLCVPRRCSFHTIKNEDVLNHNDWNCCNTHNLRKHPKYMYVCAEGMHTLMCVSMIGHASHVSAHCHQLYTLFISASFFEPGHTFNTQDIFISDSWKISESRASYLCKGKENWRHAAASFPRWRPHHSLATPLFGCNG